VTLLETELGEHSTDVSEVVADEGDVVCRNPGRHASEDAGLDEAVCESRGDKREREGGVLVSGDVGGKQRPRQIGIGVKAAPECAGHLGRITGDRDIFGEERLLLVARVALHTRGEEAGRMREPYEDRRRESIARELMGVECRLGRGWRRQEQTEPRSHDQEGSASGLQEARPMTAVHQSLDHWEHSRVERSLVPATPGAAGAAARFDLRRPPANPPAQTEFPPDYLYHLAGPIHIGRIVR
jgi:hypothetical protein